MSTVEHVLSGAGAPTNAPPSLGAHYIDTSTGELYLASGTGTPDDWRLAHSDSGWVTLEGLDEFGYPPEARRLNGVIYLRGRSMIGGGGSAAWPIAKLPEGWLPGWTMLFTKSSGDVVRTLNVDANGEIMVYGHSGGNGYAEFEFDGVSFPTN